MKINGAGRPTGIVLAVAIGLGCAVLAWLAVRTAAVAMLPPTQSVTASIASHDPDRVLNAEMMAFITKRGRLDDGDYAAIADAARAAPLDARPYMFVAAQHMMRNDNKPVIGVLEAGRRLDPRDRWIRVYLLDQYLRARRYDQAATEFAVLTRLVSAANGPIVTELAGMSTNPATAAAVRETLKRNPDLENAVLAQLATSGTPANVIIDLASPTARASAGKPGGWGVALVAALVEKHNYRAAHAVWQMIYAVPQTAAAASPYDGEFKGLIGSAPFNWSLTANETGAVDRADSSISIYYYGRELADLASQLLLLPPGQYRLTYTLSGAPGSNGDPTLSWTVGCDRHEKPLLLDGRVPPIGAKPSAVAMQFTIPADNCSAQWLKLTGTPGQFPTTMSATIQHVAIRPVQARP